MPDPDSTAVPPWAEAGPAPVTVTASPSGSDALASSFLMEIVAAV